MLWLNLFADVFLGRGSWKYTLWCHWGAAYTNLRGGWACCVLQVIRVVSETLEFYLVSFGIGIFGTVQLIWDCTWVECWWCSLVSLIQLFLNAEGGRLDLSDAMVFATTFLMRCTASLFRCYNCQHCLYLYSCFVGYHYYASWSCFYDVMC